MKTIQVGKATLIHGDCEEFMADLPDKYFDLAVVDPPYGIGVNKMTLGNGKNKIFRGSNDWDCNPPESIYFEELFRTANNQIIWGANHFINKFSRNSSAWIFWDKGTGDNDFADGELAYTSFKSTVRKFFNSWVGANAKEKSEKCRIHPTQKPVKLYEWIYSNYAKPGQTILDTHGGSMSSVIAALNMGFEITCIKKDEDYFNAAVERVIKSQQQQRMFE